MQNIANKIKYINTNDMPETLIIKDCVHSIRVRSPARMHLAQSLMNLRFRIRLHQNIIVLLRNRILDMLQDFYNCISGSLTRRKLAVEICFNRFLNFFCFGLPYAIIIKKTIDLIGLLSLRCLVMKICCISIPILDLCDPRPQVPMSFKFCV